MPALPLDQRMGNLRALVAEHVGGDAGEITGAFEVLVCDGCDISVELTAANAPEVARWRLGEHEPPDLCPACAAASGSLRHRLLVVLRVAERRARGRERKMIFVRSARSKP